MLLDKNNIKYVVNTSIEEMLALGFKKVPVLYVNGENMYFEEAKQWAVNYRKDE